MHQFVDAAIDRSIPCCVTINLKRLMSPRIWLMIAGLCGAVGVALGAWHAHGLEEFFEKSEHSGEELTKRLADFGTAVRYQMYHAAALAVIGLLRLHSLSKLSAAAGICLLLGVVLFSGGLYAWCLGGPQWLVHVVPFGGVSLILGWLFLAAAGARVKQA